MRCIREPKMISSWLLVFSLMVILSVTFTTDADIDGENKAGLCRNEGLCDPRFIGDLVSLTVAERKNCNFLMARLECLEVVASKCPKSKKRLSLISEAMEKVGKIHFDCLHRLEQADAAVEDATQGQTFCQPSEVEECLQNVYPFMKNETLSGLSVDRGERDLACSVFKSGMSCIDDYANRCLTAHQRETLERRVWGARQVMIFVCSAKMYEGHRQYSECFKVLSSKISNCSNSLQRTRLRRPYQNKEESIKDLCCAQRNFLNCMLNDAYKVCEESAIDLASKIFKSMYTPQLNRKCSVLKILDCSGCACYAIIRSHLLMFALFSIVRALHLL